MAALWQQVFALDARCNAQRTPNNSHFRALYIRRRSQLLKEAFKGGNLSFRKQYLRIRALLLQQCYGINNGIGPSYDQFNIRNKSNKVTKINNAFSKNSNSDNEALSLGPLKQAESYQASASDIATSENYVFVGVHHIFDQHLDSVVMVKFANNDRSKLCCASSDGTISLCNVTSTPPKVEIIREGHKKAVTSIDWSIDNDLILSCSLDCTIRLWKSHSLYCIRVVDDKFNSEVLCCIFQPANNNMIIAGNSKGFVYTLNVSAGIYPKGGSVKIGGKILSIVSDSLGRDIWAGNDKGMITSFHYELATGKLHKKVKVVVAINCPITCLSWKSWISRDAREPTLLVNCATNDLFLFSVENAEGNLRLIKKFNVRHKVLPVRSTFCPIMSYRQGFCFVTGSEDCCVYFFDINKDTKPVNKLQGHACPVLGVSFNYDESLLATSDLQGHVIIWKRGT